MTLSCENPSACAQALILAQVVVLSGRPGEGPGPLTSASSRASLPSRLCLLTAPAGQATSACDLSVDWAGRVHHETDEPNPGPGHVEAVPPAPCLACWSGAQERNLGLCVCPCQRPLGSIFAKTSLDVRALGRPPCGPEPGGGRECDENEPFHDVLGSFQDVL